MSRKACKAVASYRKRECSRLVMIVSVLLALLASCFSAFCDEELFETNRVLWHISIDGTDAKIVKALENLNDTFYYKFTHRIASINVVVWQDHVPEGVMLPKTKCHGDLEIPVLITFATLPPERKAHMTVSYVYKIDCHDTVNPKFPVDRLVVENKEGFDLFASGAIRLLINEIKNGFEKSPNKGLLLDAYAICVTEKVVFNEKEASPRKYEYNAILLNQAFSGLGVERWFEKDKYVNDANGSTSPRISCSEQNTNLQRRASDKIEQQQRIDFNIVELAYGMKNAPSYYPFMTMHTDNRISDIRDADVLFNAYIKLQNANVSEIQWTETRQFKDMYYRTNANDVPMYIIYCYKDNFDILYFHPK